MRSFPKALPARRGGGRQCRRIPWPRSNPGRGAGVYGSLWRGGRGGNRVASSLSISRGTTRHADRRMPSVSTGNTLPDRPSGVAMPCVRPRSNSGRMARCVRTNGGN